MTRKRYSQPTQREVEVNEAERRRRDKIELEMMAKAHSDANQAKLEKIKGHVQDTLYQFDFEVASWLDTPYGLLVLAKIANLKFKRSEVFRIKKAVRESVCKEINRNFGWHEYTGLTPHGITIVEESECDPIKWHKECIHRGESELLAACDRFSEYGKHDERTLKAINELQAALKEGRE
jgi:hypothetical protein